MCGLAGIIFGKKRRTRKEIQHLLDIFTRLLVLSEARGHHATGVSWVKTDGTYDLFKAPMPASDFVHESRYADILAGVDNKTTILMGHTRWRTQGSELNNENNHPLVLGNFDKGVVAENPAKEVILTTHNGHISNADVLFRRFRFPRQAEVDSEIIGHFAARASRGCTWDIPRFKHYCSLCQGTMAAVISSTAIPKKVIAVRGAKPLCIFSNSRNSALAYASDSALAHVAFGADTYWIRLNLPPQTINVFGHAPSETPHCK